MENVTQRAAKSSINKKLHCLDYFTPNAAINPKKLFEASLTVQPMSHSEVFANGAC